MLTECIRILVCEGEQLASPNQIIFCKFGRFLGRRALVRMHAASIFENFHRWAPDFFKMSQVGVKILRRPCGYLFVMIIYLYLA